MRNKALFLWTWFLGGSLLLPLVVLFQGLRLVGDRADGSPPTMVHLWVLPVLAMVSVFSVIPGLLLWRRTKRVLVAVTGLLIYAPCAALALVVIWVTLNGRLP